VIAAQREHRRRAVVESDLIEIGAVKQSDREVFGQRFGDARRKQNEMQRAVFRHRSKTSTLFVARANGILSTFEFCSFVRSEAIRLRSASSAAS
jgi:hypothetical protein